MAGTKDFLLLKYYNSLQSLLQAAGALRRSYTYSKDTAQDATHILLRDSAKSVQLVKQNLVVFLKI